MVSLTGLQLRLPGSLDQVVKVAVAKASRELSAGEI